MPFQKHTIFWDCIHIGDVSGAETYIAQLPAGAELQALKMVVRFIQEDYQSVLAQTSNLSQDFKILEPWTSMIQKAKENAEVGIPHSVPLFESPNLQELNRLFKESGTSVNVIIPKPKRRNALDRIKIVLGNVSGMVASGILEWLTATTGRWIGYKDEIWTNWYQKPKFIGVLCLAYMRNQLNQSNLFDTYSADEKKQLNGLLPSSPPPQVLWFRTLNGTFNNLSNPIEGAAGTRFQRNVSPASSNSCSQEDLMLPDPRKLSMVFLTRQDEMKKAPFLNLLAAAWIQFQNHDWISHTGPSTTDFYALPLADNDPIKVRYPQNKLFIGKTPIDPVHTGSTNYHYNFINEVTHWWDGSQIYGSSDTINNKLRSGHQGKMKIKDHRRLPVDLNGLEMTGFNRNWWVGLSLLHTLFVLEHNAICDALIKAYSSWDDFHLFHTARLINSALMAKIHTLEWNSAINPNESIYKGNHSNWYGLLTLVKSKKNWHTIADINVSNTELGGVVGNPTKKYGHDFGLTQEFVEAYRIHSMLPDQLEIKSLNDKNKTENIPFVKSRQLGSGKLIDAYGLTNLMYSFGLQNPGQVVLNNYPRFLQELSMPGNPVYDMGTVDILRARERGVPRYNEFRRQLGLNPIRSFEDLTTDQEIILKLKEFYGHDQDAVEKLDFMIGTLAETHRPTGFAFGETMFQLFLLNATRRLQADRFYTDCYKKEYYTQLGLDWIDRTSFKDVILRHFPELRDTGLSKVTNAFEPWDDDVLSQPHRHPLRAFEMK